MSRRVVVVSAVTPQPVDNGRRVFLAGLVEYLIARHGAENVDYALVAPPDVPDPSLECRVHRLPTPSSATKARNLSGAVLTGKGTLQEAMLSSPELKRSIASLMATEQPALEIYDTLRMGQHRAAQRSGVRQVLHLDDLYSVRYARMLETLRTLDADFDPLGEFVAHVPPIGRAVVRRPSVYRPLLRFEGKRLRRRELALVHDFDRVLLVNDREVGELRELTGHADIRLVTPLAPPAQDLQRKPVNPPEFVFLGRLNVPHNDDAICTFLREVWPGVRALLPEAKMRIIGRGTTPPLQQLVDASEGSVTLEGYVADLDELFMRASAVVAPLRFGSGVKQKILDALARSVPVVGTSVAMEGIPARLADPSQPGAADGCFASDDFGSWPAVMALLADTDTNLRWSDAVGAFYRRTYSLDVVYEQYDEVFALPQ